MRKSAPLFCALLLSLSARRAWIEIANAVDQILPGHVALRKESVDRNHVGNSTAALPSMSLSARRAWIEMRNRTHRRGLFPSLSARRAWIEISTLFGACSCPLVALRKESVDRNSSFRLGAGSLTTVALRKESVDRNVPG